MPPLLYLDPDIEPLGQLGARGVSVVAVTGKRRHPATASRWVTEVEDAPALWSDGVDAWFGSLLERHPGAVVMPGSDAWVWWLAEWRARHPEASARLAVPGLEAVHTAIAKWRLYEACPGAGLEAPRTWLAPSVEAAMEGLGVSRFPLVVKPQSRTGNLHWGQGRLVRNESELRKEVAWALEAVRFRQPVLDSLPGIDVPMAQELAPGRDRPVYHLCGYSSAGGASAVLAHRKLLQVPRRFGTGICFETAPVDGALAERLLGMLRSIGFHGMFEAEFISRDGRHLLIDLNIRPYNGLRLESERGLHLAWYAYLEALGEDGRLAEELAAARTGAHQEDIVYCRRLEFAATVFGQFAGGGFGFRQAGRWGRWCWRNRRRMVDPWVVPGDRRPGRARLWNQAGQWGRAPRVFLGVYFRPESSA